MRRLRATVAALGVTAMGVGAAPAAAETVYGVTEQQTPRLVTFDSASPDRLLTTVEISGVAGQIVGLDVRPATLEVVAINDAGQLYTLNTATGQATALPQSTGIAGATDVDFNPTVDRLRVVGSNGTGNARANPNTGGPVDADMDASNGVQPDGGLAFAAGDPQFGATPSVQATAYTSSFPASQVFPSVPTTQQLNLESGRDVLVQQTPPNDGTLRTVGPLGVDLDGRAGFDVVTDADGTTNRAYAAFAEAGQAPAFYTVDLGTGAATRVGAFAGDSPIREIAVAPVVPRLVALTQRADAPLTGGAAQALTTFPADRPSDAGGVSVAISGLPLRVSLLGIDVRPANNTLYGLGSDSRLYTVDAATGRATAVGSGPFEPALSGSQFGFDFNPQADRLRVVSDTGQNLRINPDTGAGAVAPPSAADGNLNGAASGATAAAYTNSTSPAPASTALQVIDSAGDALLAQDANPGTTSPIGPLGADFAEANGYDIAARFNHGFAVSGRELFAVNVAGAPMGAANGGAVSIGALGVSELQTVRGLAVLDASSGTPSTPLPAGVTPAKARTRIAVRVTPRRDRSRPFRYRVRGRVVPRGDAGATPFRGGRVRVLVKKAGKGRTIRRTTVRVGAAGRFSTRLTIPRKNLRKPRRGVLRFELRFGGTDALRVSRGLGRARYR